jgi:predicted acylesterase/phospholipase RssA
MEEDIAKNLFSDIAFGFAFGGGGGKAFAELGALSVLEEKGIRPSYICGVSMGSSIGSLYAAGFTSKEILDIFLSTSRRHIYPIKFQHLNAPISSDYIGPFVEEKIREKIGVSRLENLPIPMYINVTHRKPTKTIILKEGPIHECVSASSAAWGLSQHQVMDNAIRKQVEKALPGVFTPSQIIYIADGCYLTNVPTESLDILKNDIPSLQNKATYDIALDVIPSCPDPMLPGLDKFNEVIYRLDQRNEKVFLREKRGWYFELESGVTQITFSKRGILLAYENGRKIVLEEIDRLIDNLSHPHWK